MCEDGKTLHGWRVPRGCQVANQGQQVAKCRVSSVPWPQIVEFFTTRYDVQPQGDNLHVHIRGIPESSNGQTPLLLVLRQIDGVQIVALGQGQ